MTLKSKNNGTDDNKGNGTEHKGKCNGTEDNKGNDTENKGKDNGTEDQGNDTEDKGKVLKLRVMALVLALKTV